MTYKSLMYWCKAYTKVLEDKVKERGRKGQRAWVEENKQNKRNNQL